jgi:transcriptional regulator with XRE-family HTH domain
LIFPLERTNWGNQMELRERLATLRRARGYTLRELRDRIQLFSGERMSVSYLSELEHEPTAPSVEILSRLAKGYEMTLRELLEPVAIDTEPVQVSYPPSLVAFVRGRNLSEQWLETLSRIEYRGKRPETVEDWNAIYSVLRLTMARNERE